MNSKQQFPDETTLRNHIQSNIDSFVQQTKTAVGPLEAQYKEKSKQQKQGIILIVLAFLVLFVVMPALSSFFEATAGLAIFSWVFLLSCLFGAGALGWLAWKKLQGTTAAIQAFHTALNNFLYPLAFEMFDLKAIRTNQTIKQNKDPEKPANENFLAKLTSWAKAAQQSYSSPEEDAVMALLDHSELITEPRNRVTIDDMVTATYKERTLAFSELSVKHVTGSGKNRQTKHIFHGYFVSFELERSLTGKTFVSTEGDKSGFAHQSFFTTKKNEGLEQTELEWNDFEDLLHVVTNDPTEARYILTPDFMLDLHDWWLNQKQNIRLSFLDNKMYMLFPDTEIRIGKTVKQIDREQMQAYLESIGIPLLHALHLIEDIQQ